MPGADTSQRIAVLFALPEESAPFLRQVRPRAEKFVVGVSGVGRQKAAQEATHLLRERNIKALLICGFAGGLQGLSGDIVIAERVLEADNPILPYSPDTGLLAYMQVFAESSGWQDLWRESPMTPVISAGTLITTDRVMVTREEKRALAERTGAIAVDMETAGAARVAQEHGVPWLAVRAITDGVDDTLPFDFNQFSDADGNVNRGRIVLATLTHPWKIPALLRLGQRSSRAAGNLAKFLETFLQTLPD